MRQTVCEAAPEDTEAISYQMPTLKLNGNLVYFVERELFPNVKGKGALQFPLNKPIPYDLVEKLVIFRVNENMMKVHQKNLENQSLG